MAEPIKVYLVWAELDDGTRIVHAVKMSRRSADYLVRRAMTEEPEGCGCCYGPSPAQILGIKDLFVEERLADPGDPEREEREERYLGGSR